MWNSMMMNDVDKLEELINEEMKKDVDKVREFFN
jgi:hypothetical protein